MSTKRALSVVLLVSVVMLAAKAAPAQALPSHQEGEPLGATTPDSRRPLEKTGLALQSLDAAASTASGPVGQSFVIRAEAEQEVEPAIAYNSQWQEYLVVFWNDRPGCDDIRAERVSRDGKLLGGKWIAAGCPAENRFPDVAYNTQRNEYLIVWLEESGGFNYVRSQRFSANLTPQPEGMQTLYAIPASLGVYVYSPAVAYAYTSNKYLAVWQMWVVASSQESIVGHAVSFNGQPDPGGSFNISLDPGGQPRRNPDLAYNRHANGFLVVWKQLVGVTFDIYARLVNGDGSIPPSSSPFEIANDVRDCGNPAVAAIPTAPGSYKYLVVWEYDFGPGDQDIRGRLVQENGTPHPSRFDIANELAAETSPAVSGTEYGYRYLVTWRSARGTVDNPIVGRAVSHEGWLVSDPAEFPGPAANYPAVAAGPAGDFLVTWQDQPVWATNTNIYGQLWGNRVYLPLVLRN